MANSDAWKLRAEAADVRGRAAEIRNHSRGNDDAYANRLLAEAVLLEVAAERELRRG